MDELLKNELFACGIVVGISLYENRIISAYKHKEPLVVGESLYFLQDGKERLAEILDEMCR